MRNVALVCLTLLGCGGAAPTPTRVDRSGEYRGPNELAFALTAPVQRQMPPERHNGSAVVTDALGDVVTLELRMFEGGDTCRIEARRTGEPQAGATREELTVEPGQRCSSRFRYEGSPVAAIVEIETGTVRLGPGEMAVQLRGRFVADVAVDEGSTTETEGVARFEFEGSR